SYLAQTALAAASCSCVMRRILLLALAAGVFRFRHGAFTGPSIRPEVPKTFSALRAKVEADDEVDDESDDESDEVDEVDEIDDDEEEMALKTDYAWDEQPPNAWYQKRSIDRHKVNMKFFDMFKKPKDFFPHKLQAGDTVRVHYLEARPSGDKETRSFSVSKDQLRETYFDGTVLNFRGDYHARTMTVRAMIGKGVDSVGYEFLFPIHSPLITRIQVLKRGFIGRNKNAYFMRGMVGKRNVIPLDQERAEMDKMYASLRLDGRENEIPSPEYPANEWDTYPLPVWKQDMADWKEEDYDPDKVDQRSEYELRVIAKYKMRVSRTGKYGT
ncbi:50S ribosomal protein L19, partial [Durusdinium trenchii]